MADKAGVRNRAGTPSSAAVPFVLCPVDDQSCEAVDPIESALRESLTSRGLAPERVAAWLRPLLPCERCRFCEAAAEGLGGLRLGRHERNILLNAAKPDAAHGAIIDPEATTHSDRETNLRAARKLNRAGLLRMGRTRVRVETSGQRSDGTSIRRRYLMRTVWQTPFGERISELYRPELSSGRPIRWKDRVRQALSEVRLPQPALARYFAEGLRAGISGEHATSDELRVCISQLLEEWTAAASP